MSVVRRGQHRLHACCQSDSGSSDSTGTRVVDGTCRKDSSKHTIPESCRISDGCMCLHCWYKLPVPSRLLFRWRTGPLSREVEAYVVAGRQTGNGKDNPDFHWAETLYSSSNPFIFFVDPISEASLCSREAAFRGEKSA